MASEQPIRFAVVADTHADESSRFDEHNDIMHWIAEDAAKRGCCVMLHGGDVYERRSTSRERLAVVDWITAVAKRGMSLVMVAGNHDDPLDIELLGRLRRIGPDSVTIRAATRAESILVSAPGHYDVLQVHCLPWPRKGNIASLLSREAPDFDGSALDARTVDALRNVLRGFAANRWSSTTPTVLLGHCMVRGSRASEAQPPLVGMDFELSCEDLELAQTDFVALGHIHLAQEWERTPAAPPIVYVGNPRRNNFGELDEKGYIVLEWHPVHGVFSWERVPTPARKMYHVDALRSSPGEAVPAALMLPSGLPSSFDGGEVRLRYPVYARDRAAARANAEELRRTLMGLGAGSVKVEEEIIVETRARAPEVTLAPTIAGKLAAYWDQQAAPPDHDARASMLVKLAAIEEAAS